MKRNNYYSGAMIRIGLLLSLTMLFTLCKRPVKIAHEVYDQIQEGFITPADTNKPWCYFIWIGKTSNLMDQSPEKAKELFNVLEAWREDVKAEFLITNPDFKSDRRYEWAKHPDRKIR